MILALLTLGGCAAEDEPAAPAASASAAYPVSAGGVTLDRRPERIVSLSPTATETLFAIGAGPQVVAVDDQSDFPAGVPVTDLSGFQPNAEAIAARTPDLVVIANDINDIVRSLTELKIPVYTAAAPATLDDGFRQWRELGALTGHAAEAADLATRTGAEIDKLVAGLPARERPLTYYYELGPELYSATSTTFVGALLGRAGLANVADPADSAGAAGGYPQLNQEFLVKANPDLIFLADVTCCAQSAETVAARPGWNTMTAVRERRIVPLDDDVASRWGPRVVDLVRAVTDAVAKVPA
ncbi:iron complex transport system substrate-binding protein [Catenuloplanes atrovinosus]|uniref:Iron complex transport system substrate-binding protein n=1 Tax=Catenuloplanes atrovinosus TaxID=137266 RepID=A0AAE4CE58_9ACTN|nr:iron complex transport system substrate-binding protein [Catenuloplanes atrovinosus]